MSYATPADLASFLQQDVDTASAQMALDGASARIDSVTRGWRFLPVAETTAALRGGSGSLRLQRPVTAVTSVSSTSLGLTTALAVNVDYDVIGPQLRWLRYGAWPETVSVTYSRGMAAVPADVKDACLRLAALRYLNPLGYESRSETVGGTAESGTWASGGTGAEGPILADIRRAYPSAGLSVQLSLA